MSNPPRRSLSDLEQPDRFVGRHVGPGPDDEQAMLDALAMTSLDDLVRSAVPAAIRDETLDLPEPRDESSALVALRELAARNTVLTSLIGLGYSDTITPPVILRNVLENPAWYTAYTPYQP
ncbi:MAG: glycine dehydrogenase (aminomethyl-transferring), partial [Acidimicrobiia bacterium]|nr:glycine dehydrogenase (aminomethyl-transferring) [Acidimicrobiia bacterium]